MKSSFNTNHMESLETRQLLTAEGTADEASCTFDQGLNQPEAPNCQKIMEDISAGSYLLALAENYTPAVIKAFTYAAPFVTVKGMLVAKNLLAPSPSSHGKTHSKGWIEAVAKNLPSVAWIAGYFIHQNWVDNLHEQRAEKPHDPLFKYIPQLWALSYADRLQASLTEELPNKCMATWDMSSAAKAIGGAAVMAGTGLKPGHIELA